MTMSQSREFREVSPDQSSLLRSAPTFELFLSCNCIQRGREFFHMYQPQWSPIMRVAGRVQSLLMLVESTFNVIRDARVVTPIIAQENVDGEPPKTHGSSFRDGRGNGKACCNILGSRIDVYVILFRKYQFYGFMERDVPRACRGEP